MEYLFLGGFLLLIIAVLLFDLLFIGKNTHTLSFKEALTWTSVWVCLSMLFYLFLMLFGDKLHKITDINSLIEIASKYSPALKLDITDFSTAIKAYRMNMATEYITGYFLEYTLSIDNVFVIMMILASFSVEPSNYKKILFWGILGAIILRFIFIFAGSVLVQRFDWVLLIFGAILIYSGIKMFLERNKEEAIEIHDHFLVKYLSKHFKVYPTFYKDKFFYKQEGITYLTPLLIVLILIEFTDLIFAVDSIPAIFSVTKDPYIVFFSNIFAIIGLRSLFFLLIKVVDYFHSLKVGVSFLLFYIGLKLLFHQFLDEIGFKNVYSLIIIFFTLIISIVASIIFPKKNDKIIE